MNKAIEFLLQVRDIDNQIVNLEEQIEMWRVQACRCTSDPSAVPSGSRSHTSRLEEYAIKIADAETECEHLRSALVGVKQHVIVAVEDIPDITQRRVLLNRYIHRPDANRLTPWDEVAKRVNYSKEQTVRIHGRALQSLIAILER